MKNSELKIEILKLYKGSKRVDGPYLHTNKDRLFMQVCFKGRKHISKQRAKFKMEVKLGKILPRNITVNHKDGNAMNDKYSNLELISLSENIKHAHATGIMDKAYKVTRKRMMYNTLGQGDRNGQAKFLNSEVKLYRKMALNLSSKKDRSKFMRRIAKLHSCSERTVRNALTGVSYSHIATKLVKLTK